MWTEMKFVSMRGGSCVLENISGIVRFRCGNSVTSFHTRFSEFVRQWLVIEINLFFVEYLLNVR